MKHAQFIELASIAMPAPPSLSVGELTDLSDRTLVVGRTTGAPDHIALVGGRIRCARYVGFDVDRAAAGAGEWDYSSSESWPLTAFEGITAYPELCDFEFMALLRARGVRVSYEPFDNDGTREVRLLPF